MQVPATRFSDLSGFSARRVPARPGGAVPGRGDATPALRDAEVRPEPVRPGRGRGGVLHALKSGAKDLIARVTAGARHHASGLKLDDAGRKEVIGALAAFEDAVRGVAQKSNASGGVNPEAIGDALQSAFDDLAGTLEGLAGPASALSADAPVSPRGTQGVAPDGGASLDRLAGLFSDALGSLLDSIRGASAPTIDVRA